MMIYLLTMSMLYTSKSQNPEPKPSKKLKWTEEEYAAWKKDSFKLKEGEKGKTRVEEMAEVPVAIKLRVNIWRDCRMYISHIPQQMFNIVGLFVTLQFPHHYNWCLIFFPLNTFYFSVRKATSLGEMEVIVLHTILQVR